MLSLQVDLPESVRRRAESRLLRFGWRFNILMPKLPALDSRAVLRGLRWAFLATAVAATALNNEKGGTDAGFNFHPI